MSIMLVRPLTAIQILWINLVTDGLRLWPRVSPQGRVTPRPRGSRENICRWHVFGCPARMSNRCLRLAAHYLGIRRGSVEMARTMAFATLACPLAGHERQVNPVNFHNLLFSNKNLVLRCGLST